MNLKTREQLIKNILQEIICNFFKIVLLCDVNVKAKDLFRWEENIMILCEYKYRQDDRQILWDCCKN